MRAVVEIGFYAWFFYRSFWAMVPLTAVGVYRLIMYGRQMEKKKKRDFEIQFQECIMAVSTALRAGYSLENAFAESVYDMRILFGDKSRIVGELQGICRGLKNNLSMETILEGLGERSESSAVKEFADIVKIAIMSGGNLVEIIGNTAEIMGQERQMVEEIADLVSGKKMEGKIMSLIPFLMILYVQCSNPGYFDVFYHNSSGIFIMSICLVVYLFAVGAIEKILEIAK